MVWRHFDSELGRLLCAATDMGVCFLAWAAEGDLAPLELFGKRHGLELGGPADVSDGSACRGHLGRAVDQLVSYSKGDLHAFDLPLDLRGTEFQVRVWAALLDIPRGATITYGELARRVDCPGGSQAVGSANGSNPVPIVVPCHRVVAANGLGGFTGGLARKEALLAIEGTLLL